MLKIALLILLPTFQLNAQPHRELEFKSSDLIASTIDLSEVLSPTEDSIRISSIDYVDEAEALSEIFCARTKMPLRVYLYDLTSLLPVKFRPMVYLSGKALLINVEALRFSLYRNTSLRRTRWKDLDSFKLFIDGKDKRPVALNLSMRPAKNFGDQALFHSLEQCEAAVESQKNLLER